MLHCVAKKKKILFVCNGISSLMQKYDGLPLLALNYSLNINSMSLPNDTIMHYGEEQAYCIIFIVLKCGSGKLNR